MANGGNHDRLTQRQDELERRFEDRSSRRDQTEAETRELLADLAARVASAEKAADKSPSWVALVAAGVGIAGLLGGLGSYALLPYQKDIAEIKGDARTMQNRQLLVMQRVARLEGKADVLAEQVQDIDKIGSRKR